MSKHGITGFVALMFCQLCLAGPPDKAIIPDSASWIAHLDVEGMMATKTFKALSEFVNFGISAQQDAKDNGGKKAVPSTQEQLVFDMLKDIKSVTAYGLTGSETQPVITVTGKLNKATILAMVGLSEDKPSEMYGSRKIFLVGNKEQNPGYVCFYDENTIIASPSITSLHSAMDLADGSGKKLAKDNPLWDMLTCDNGFVAVIAARDISSYAKLVRKESPVAAAVMSKIKNACLRVGETDEKIRLSASISAINEEQAANVEQAIKGLVAMAELASDDSNGMAAIINLVKPVISRDGLKVDVEVKASLTDIMISLMSLQFEKGFEHHGHKALDKNKPGTKPQPAASQP